MLIYWNCKERHFLFSKDVCPIVLLVLCRQGKGWRSVFILRSILIRYFVHPLRSIVFRFHSLNFAKENVVLKKYLGGKEEHMLGERVFLRQNCKAKKYVTVGTQREYLIWRYFKLLIEKFMRKYTLWKILQVWKYSFEQIVIFKKSFKIPQKMSQNPGCTTLGSN